jgi:D-alanyl-D-alanine carboxypeptidase
LLNHTSGVPNYSNLELLLDMFDDPAKRFTPQDLLTRIEGQPLNFVPGTAASYTNTGFVLLGLVIQRATGHPLEAELRRRNLAPLHLTDTSFETDQRGWF